MKRQKQYDIYEVGYKLPVASLYIFIDNFGKIFTGNTYFKSWYKKLLKQRGRNEA